MLPFWKKIILAISALSLICCFGGCRFGGKKDKKPVPQPTTKVEDGNAKAKGSGEGQSEVPLVVGCGKISNKINPFSNLTVADRQAVSLTQLKLVTYDRNGQVVYHAIDGEVRPYKDTDYTYYGPSDIDVEYDRGKNETVYSVKIREDLKFSNAQGVTIDDVIFTMYVLCDVSYKGAEPLGKSNIKGLKNYIKGKAKNIAGINKTGDYQMTVTTMGYDKDFIYSLQFPICPLSYYGDAKKYDYVNNKFGYERGDISSVIKDKTSLIGGGAYRFVKFEKGIAYFTSNEMYYRGCPKVAYLQMKEMDKILAADDELLPPEAIEVYEGTVDIIEFMANAEDFKQISSYDYDGKKSEDVFLRHLITTDKFYTIGINAKHVRVGTKSTGKKSRRLRNMFQEAFKDSEELLDGIYGDALKTIEYPYAPDSWLYPVDGNDGEESDRAEKKALFEHLKEAGYKIKSEKAIKAPKGAKMEYSIGIIGGHTNPVYPVVNKAAESLKDAGIVLKIVPVKSNEILNKKLMNGSLQLWVEESGAESMHNLYEYYIGQNSRFGIESAKLKLLLAKSEKMMSDDERKECFLRCFEGVEKLYVNIPLFQQSKTILMGKTRLKHDTITTDMTPYYSWIDEIHLIEKK